MLGDTAIHELRRLIRDKILSLHESSAPALCLVTLVGAVEEEAGAVAVEVVEADLAVVDQVAEDPAAVVRAAGGPGVEFHSEEAPAAEVLRRTVVEAVAAPL